MHGDEAIAALGIQDIPVIKVDVEGAEHRVPRPMKLLPAAFLLLALCGGCSDDAASPNRQSGGPAALSGGASAGLKLAGRVTDAANILDAAQEARLTAELARLEKATGGQIVVVTTPTLGGEDVAAFTTALGNRWGIGIKAKQDGLILLGKALG